MFWRDDTVLVQNRLPRVVCDGIYDCVNIYDCVKLCIKHRESRSRLKKVGLKSRFGPREREPTSPSAQWIRVPLSLSKLRTNLYSGMLLLNVKIKPSLIPLQLICNQRRSFVCTSRTGFITFRFIT